MGGQTCVILGEGLEKGAQKGERGRRREGGLIGDLKFKRGGCQQGKIDQLQGHIHGGAENASGRVKRKEGRETQSVILA